MMYKKKLFYLILVCALIRIVIALVLELGNDEVYYYTYALHLQSSYFDHPPGVALLIKLFTLNLALPQQFFIRLGSLVCAAIGTVLAFSTGRLVRNERSGWIAAILYNTSIYSSIIAGTFILPDSPQVVFWLAALYFMLTIVKQRSQNISVPFVNWIAFGAMAGCCIMCKVHGVFLWGGFGLYAIFCDRKVFGAPGFYVAALVTAIVIFPVFWWNYQNHFVTWNYHSKRVEGIHLDKDSFIQAFFGQVFYNNPVNVIITVVAIINQKRRLFLKTHFSWLLLFTGLPMIAVVTVMSLFNSVLPHWSGPGFLTLSFFAAVYIEKKLPAEKVFKLPLVLKLSAGLILIVCVAGILLIKLFPGTIGSKNPDKLGEGDFTLDMYGWKKFNTDFSVWRGQEESKYHFSADIKFVSNKWFPASHIEYYIARPANTFVVGIGKPEDLHQFAWLNQYRPGLQPKENALCIVPTNYPSDPLKDYAKYFSSVQLLKVFPQYRNNKICRNFKIYLLQGFSGTKNMVE